MRVYQAEGRKDIKEAVEQDRRPKERQKHYKDLKCYVKDHNIKSGASSRQSIGYVQGKKRRPINREVSARRTAERGQARGDREMSGVTEFI